MIAEKDRIISTARTSETESAEEESRSQLVLLVAFAIVRSFGEGSFLRQEWGGLGGKEGRCGYGGRVDGEVCRGGDLMWKTGRGFGR